MLDDNGAVKVLILWPLPGSHLYYFFLISEDSPSQKLAKWKVNSVAEQCRPQYTGAEDLEWTSWIIFHFNFHLQCKLRCSAGCSAAVLMKCWNTFDFRFMPSSCSEYQVTLCTYSTHTCKRNVKQRALCYHNGNNRNNMDCFSTFFLLSPLIWIWISLLNALPLSTDTGPHVVRTRRACTFPTSCT